MCEGQAGRSLSLARSGAGATPVPAQPSPARPAGIPPHPSAHHTAPLRTVPPEIFEKGEGLLRNMSSSMETFLRFSIKPAELPPLCLVETQ